MYMYMNRVGNYMTFLVLFSVKMSYFIHFALFWLYFGYSKNYIKKRISVF